MLFQTSCPKLRSLYSTAIQVFELLTFSRLQWRLTNLAHKNNEFNMILQLQWEEATDEWNCQNNKKLFQSVIDRVLKK